MAMTIAKIFFAKKDLQNNREAQNKFPIDCYNSL